MYSTVINNSVKLIIVASVFVFSGCGGGGKTPVTEEPSTNIDTPSTGEPTEPNTASSTLTASNYSVMLAVNKASSNSDWFVRSKALDTEGDALSATITTQGKYGTFTITNHGLSYLKTTESKEIDTGVLSISDGTHTVSITVGVHTPEWKQISAENHTAVINGDGTLWAWGSNEYGQLGDGTTEDKLVPTQESTMSNDWKSVVAGSNFTIAIKNDGTLWAWGRNYFGQLGDSTTVNKLVPTQESSKTIAWKSVVVGAQFTVAIKNDGTLWAWGNNKTGQLGDGTTEDKLVPTQESTKANNWQSISTGFYHTLAIKNDGTLWAWGSNGAGQLGDGTLEDISVPIQESTSATDWKNLTAGLRHSLALKNNGTLWAWGNNQYGQLGDGTTTDKLVPTQESTGATNWQSIMGKLRHTIALKNDGTLWAWGNNKYGQLGDGTTEHKLVPTQENTLSNDWQSGVAGYEHSLALKNDGSLWAWGNNEYGQLGNGFITDKLVPTQERTLASDWQSVEVGSEHTVALKSNGTLWSWGRNHQGQLGDGTNFTEPMPIQESTVATNWQSIEAEGAHTVALKSDGTLWAWGINVDLMPTQESTASTEWKSAVINHTSIVASKSDGSLWAWGAHSPGGVGNGGDMSTDWQSVSIKSSSIVALKNNGTLWSWGRNNHGQLGHGTTTETPVAIPTQENSGATNWQSVAQAANHTIAIKSDGTLWAWGNNQYGQLGDGTRDNKSIPTQENTKSTNWKSVEAGQKYTVALKSDGTLWAWGNNQYGQLGIGTTLIKSTPTQEGTFSTDWKSITVKGKHTVALKNDGTLWAWGKNYYGQLGNGTKRGKRIPTQESTTSTEWKSIAAGNNHTIAIKNDGTLWTWGDNQYGQLTGWTIIPTLSQPRE